MSSPPAASSGDAPPEQKPARKFPPPCWTQEEATALIDAYGERWDSVRRGYLRAADWDAVAEAVASRFPEAPVRKTPAQCRHKMEKLRQRHRAEKHRAGSVPRYQSSWLYFDKMEAMDGGAGGGEKQKDSNGGASSFAEMRSFLDPNLLKLKLKASIDPNPDPGLGSGNPFHDFTRLKASTNRIAGHPMNLHHYPTNEDRDEGYGLRDRRDPPPAKKSKRGKRIPVDEIVASIKFLGEGYLEIERAKMDLSREMEAMRMEMEKKRNMMMLDSQRLIVDAFAKGMMEIKKIKEVKVRSPAVKS